MLVKTIKGREELEARRYRMPSSLRPVLIMVDGKTNLKNLLTAGDGIPGFFESLMTLCDQGFIAPGGAPEVMQERNGSDPASNPLEADTKDKLIRLANVLLGAQAKNVIRKIEDSAYNKDELTASVNGCFKLIKFAIDEKKAEEFLHTAKDILAKWK